MAKFLLIFISVLFLDGLILPALFGFRSSLLSLMFLFVTILFFGSKKRYIFYVLFFSIVTESFQGLNFGDLTLPLFVVMVLIILIQRFFDIKYTYDTRFNLVKSCSVVILSLIIFHIFTALCGGKLQDIFLHSFFINFTVLVEAIILVLIFSLVFNEKKYFNV